MARVLITGCSTGIGRAAVEVLAGRGHEVLATARRPEVLAGLPAAEVLALDVQDDASVAAAVARTGPVDAVVNNAGIAVRGPVESTPVDAARNVFDVNVLGALRVTSAYLPSMRARGAGVIVNVSSLVGRVVLPMAGVYAASKFALEAVSDALRLELAHDGVRVVVVQPGLVSTGAFEASPVHLPADGSYAALAGRLAGGRPAPTTPEEVAEAVALAIEDPSGPARRVVGPDAEQLLAARAALDDEAFERTLRATLALDG